MNAWHHLLWFHDLISHERLSIVKSRIATLLKYWTAASLLAGAFADSPFADPSVDNRDSLAVGAMINVNGRSAVVKRLDHLPLIQSQFTERFYFDSFANPNLKKLREQYQLETVIAEGKDEFDRQVLLLDWAHRQFTKFGHPTVRVQGALEILDGIERGHTFFCAQYAQLYVSAAASLGWIDRILALRCHQDSPGGGATEHSTTEIWSNHFGKWIMMDPTANMHITKDGIPLNAFEIRQEWFYEGGEHLVFVIGKDRKQYRKADLPIFLNRFAGFGDLTVPADELNKYGFIGYVPNTDLMDSGLDYGRMFITKDELCEGTQWHTRIAPPTPAIDPYFPINQSTVELASDKEGVQVALRTMTPNFKTFERSVDGAPWEPVSDEFTWSIHPGTNQLQLRSVNLFGARGPVSTVEIEQ